MKIIWNTGKYSLTLEDQHNCRDMFPTKFRGSLRTIVELASVY